MGNKVQEAWLDYERMVVHGEANDRQRAEMRGAFIAGMFNFNLMLMEAVGDKNTSNEIAETKIIKLNMELENEIKEYREKPSLKIYTDRKEVVHE